MGSATMTMTDDQVWIWLVKVCGGLDICSLPPTSNIREGVSQRFTNTFFCERKRKERNENEIELNNNNNNNK